MACTISSGSLWGCRSKAASSVAKSSSERYSARTNPFGPYKLDGKPYPVTGVAAYDATSYKMVNDSTAEVVRSKGDKTIQTGTRVLSADETLTLSFTGLNAKGEKINDVAVYDKQ